MLEFITNLQTTVTSLSLWAELYPFALLIAAIVLFSFGFHSIRAVIRNAQDVAYRKNRGPL